MRFCCPDCLDNTGPFDGRTERCVPCQEAFEEQQRIDDMSDEAYARFKAQQSNRVFRVLSNLKVAS